ncbi:hypothetical protein H8784_02940 [Parabacteroides acidifaciens]|uniref:Glycosyltransferase RgtA/B/C/D-like domain-containing protein n=1 Tax=Parabacteroides acidifaciens TaxID=2290935 RepID=A0A3D8HIX2_9BACT|nr:DUF6057 family protein [Parabacteroides acidifaciens]MBC8600673.1 hypothetical protein [Parabacteroides acidifaciens]RDU50672.1 hypothetical protein DWU89_02990 [Parabacteroides acidifaciens]
MAKREVLLQSIAVVIFAVICFVFFRFACSADLFRKEQVDDLFTMSTFLSYLNKPAWFVCYAGNALISIVGLSGAPVLVTFVLLLEWWILISVLKRFRVGEMAPLYAFLPIVLEWGTYCHPGYLLHSILSTIVALFIFWRYTYIKNKWLSMLAGLLALPVIYFLAGNRLNIFVLLVLFYETCKEPKRWLYWCLLLVAGSIVPVWMGHFYSLTQEQAYLYPHNGLPAFFPPILFCFSLLLLQMKRFREMPCRVVPVTVMTCVLLALLGSVIYTYADF